MRAAGSARCDRGPSGVRLCFVHVQVGGQLLAVGDAGLRAAETRQPQTESAACSCVRRSVASRTIASASTAGSSEPSASIADLPELAVATSLRALGAEEVAR